MTEKHATTRTRDLIAGSVMLLALAVLSGCQGYDKNVRWIGDGAIPDKGRATSEHGLGDDVAGRIDDALRR